MLCGWPDCHIGEKSAEKLSVRRPDFLQHRYTLQSIKLVALTGRLVVLIILYPSCGSDSFSRSRLERPNRRSFDFLFFAPVDCLIERWSTPVDMIFQLFVSERQLHKTLPVICRE